MSFLYLFNVDKPWVLNFDVRLNQMKSYKTGSGNVLNQILKLSWKESIIENEQEAPKVFFLPNQNIKTTTKVTSNELAY